MQCTGCNRPVREDFAACPACGADLAYYVLGADRQPYGPYPLSAVRQYVAEGRIAPDAQVSQSGGPRLRLCADDGTTQVGAGVADDGSAGFSVCDKSGATRLAAQTLADGRTILTLARAETSDTGVMLQVGPGDAMTLVFGDEPGESAIELGVSADRRRYLLLKEEESTARCSLAVFPDQDKAQLQMGARDEGLHHACIVSEPQGSLMHVGHHEGGAAAQLDVS